MVGALGFVSLGQLAFAIGLSAKATRRHMRALFDAALVDVVAVSRDALAPSAASRTGAVTGGSAPNFFRLTGAGLRALRDQGFEGIAAAGRAVVPSLLWTSHAVMVGDAYAWLRRAAREHGHVVESWRDGVRAEIALGRERPPRTVRPDAWFAYRLGAHTLIGLLEADRGTEKGGRRWGEKLDAYGALFAGDRLRELTGYVGARVIVVAPDARRRDALAAFIRERAPASLARRFWLAEHSVLRQPHLDQGAWRRPLADGLHPLVPLELLAAAQTAGHGDGRE